MTEQTCPNCGAKDVREAGAAVSECAGCGAALGAAGGATPSKRRAREYDGYAVGRRVVSIAPAWLLLMMAALVAVLLALSWAARPVGDGGATGEGFRNEATNRAPARDAGTAARDSKAPAATDAGGGAAKVETAAPAASPAAEGAGAAGDSTDERGVFSVQAGAFADVSQANELVSRLRAAGFEARVVESGEATRFRFQVRSGRYAAREEAAALGARLRAAGVAGETVIVEPKKE